MNIVIRHEYLKKKWEPLLGGIDLLPDDLEILRDAPEYTENNKDLFPEHD